MALTASIANEASSALELTPSMPAFALFDASDIIVGVSASATNWRTRHYGGAEWDVAPPFSAVCPDDRRSKRDRQQTASVML
jgi:hypothetical protein